MPFAPYVLEEDAADVFEVTSANRYTAGFITITTAVTTLSLLWSAGQRLAGTGPALRRVGGTV